MVVLGNATRNDFCSSFIFFDCNCLFIRIKKSEHQICVFAVRGTRRSTEQADGGVIYTIKPSAWMAASKRLLTKITGGKRQLVRLGIITNFSFYEFHIRLKEAAGCIGEPQWTCGLREVAT